MRLAVLSDIHGNLLALEAVLADIARLGSVDDVIVAGDLVWSGPWPAEVVDRVRALCAKSIQGNTDAFFMLRHSETPPGKQEGRFSEHLAWMLEQLGPERAAFLRDLPFSYRLTTQAAPELLVVHANPDDLERPILPDMSEGELDELLLRNSGEPGWQTLAFGHVHTPFTRLWRGRTLVDVASVGLPMDGDPRAAYAILTSDRDAWQVIHRRVPYDVTTVAARMRTSGLPRGKHFAERLLAASYGGTPLAALRQPRHQDVK